jgi:hypothetical protein
MNLFQKANISLLGIRGVTEEWQFFYMKNVLFLSVIWQNKLNLIGRILMSDVEKFWSAVAAKFGDNRNWHQLNPMEQQMIIQGINMILQVVAK